MQRRLLLDPVDAQPYQSLSGRCHYSEDRLGNVIKTFPRSRIRGRISAIPSAISLCGLMPEMAEQLRPAGKVTMGIAYNPFR